MLDGAHSTHTVDQEIRVKGSSRLRVHRDVLRSATRPLEVIELFAARRCPLSVSEIACALEIPQSSSSVLLQAMSRAGFLVRDGRTRKYLPSVRSALFGNWMHDEADERGGVFRALDRLGNEAEVRLGVRNGLHVQYIHVSPCDPQVTGATVKPGTKLPIGRDALGRMLLIDESEQDLRAIIRHANATGELSQRVDIETLVEELRQHRRDGFAACADFTGQRTTVLAIRLPSRFGETAAIGFALASDRLPAERSRLLGLLRQFAEQDWKQEPFRKEAAAGAPAALDHSIWRDAQ